VPSYLCEHSSLVSSRNEWFRDILRYGYSPLVPLRSYINVTEQARHSLRLARLISFKEKCMTRDRNPQDTRRDFKLTRLLKIILMCHNLIFTQAHMMSLAYGHFYTPKRKILPQARVVRKFLAADKLLVSFHLVLYPMMSCLPS
jgi:hypothetical protein